MGIKAGPGTHTFTPTSPVGPPYLVTVSSDGNTMMHAGIAHQWDSASGRYKARIPPPPSDPPGEWHSIEMLADDGFNVYQMHNDDVWVETGRAYYNG